MADNAPASIRLPAELRMFACAMYLRALSHEQLIEFIFKGDVEARTRTKAEYKEHLVPLATTLKNQLQDKRNKSAFQLHSDELEKRSALSRNPRPKRLRGMRPGDNQLGLGDGSDAPAHEEADLDQAIDSRPEDAASSGVMDATDAPDAVPGGSGGDNAGIEPGAGTDDAAADRDRPELSHASLVQAAR